ncbi:MAG: adenosylmethionine--8-amino-7-oxononanoate transaminase [Flavobacteriales bacterium]|jgi:adenosylmethionine-8-amino-7-oxononanoate aminotransferase|nr:adenosylmethionine--8-amino-7-oxononanoate transaminase [Flavobacteriales bacterium]
MTLKEKDQKFLWHPLTQHKIQKENIPIIKAQNCTLWDENGNTYIDGIASWYTAMYGHCNAYITAKVAQQMSQLDQVVFAGFTHKPAVELGEKVMKILPKNQSKIFFSDNGSTSVDIALKMAIQYHFNKGEARKKILCFQEAFHGDTFGAMAVSGLSVYNGPFADFVMEVEDISVPNDKHWEEILADFKKKMESKEFACFIFEPLVQGAAAMKMYPAKFLDEMIHIAQKNGTLCIADEVMTGFGKTGKNFATEYLENQADIICMSKALTAGLMPMALTSCSEEIYQAFYSDQIADGFFHGHTYSANPLACTAAIAGIELLESKEIQQNIQNIHQNHLDFAICLKQNPKVKNTRVLGVILAFELNVSWERYGNQRDKMFQFLMKRGVYLRPLGNTLYILPPYTISEKELEIIYNSLKELIDEMV